MANVEKKPEHPQVSSKTFSLFISDRRMKAFVKRFILKHDGKLKNLSIRILKSIPEYALSVDEIIVDSSFLGRTVTNLLSNQLIPTLGNNSKLTKIFHFRYIVGLSCKKCPSELQMKYQIRTASDLMLLHLELEQKYANRVEWHFPDSVLFHNNNGTEMKSVRLLFRKNYRENEKDRMEN